MVSRTHSLTHSLADSLADALIDSRLRVHVRVRDRTHARTHGTNGAHNKQFYEVLPDVAISNATDLTAEFLLARGPFAWLGYGWIGCTNGDEARPRPTAWDVDYGAPDGPCTETHANVSNVFTRSWSKATVTWDCNTGHGSIEMK